MKWNGVNIGDKIRQNSNVVKAISYLNGTFTFTKGDNTTQEIATSGGGSSSPVLIGYAGGRVQHGTYQNGKMMALGGSIGTHYYNWSTPFRNTDYNALGTPGTTTLNSVTAYVAMQSGLYVPCDGTVKLVGYLEDDSAATVAGSTNYFYALKFSDSYVTNSLNQGGTLSAADTVTIVASASTTTPSSSANIYPVAFETTNGATVSEGDWLFVGFDSTATVTATEYRIISWQLFIEPS